MDLPQLRVGSQGLIVAFHGPAEVAHCHPDAAPALQGQRVARVLCEDLVERLQGLFVHPPAEKEHPLLVPHALEARVLSQRLFVIQEGHRGVSLAHVIVPDLLEPAGVRLGNLLERVFAVPGGLGALLHLEHALVLVPHRGVLGARGRAAGQYDRGNPHRHDQEDRIFPGRFHQFSPSLKAFLSPARSRPTRTLTLTLSRSKPPTFFICVIPGMAPLTRRAVNSASPR